MFSAVALNPGYPGAGRVVRELSLVSPKVKYEGEGLNMPGDLTDWAGAVDFMFLPAWHPQYPFIKHDKKVVVFTSPIIQSEYTPVEFEYMRQILDLLDHGKLHAVWFGSPDWLPYVKKNDRKAFYCPYPVTLPSAWKRTPINNPPKNVGLFGPGGPRKNVAVQAMAAAKAGCNLHVTDDSVGPILKTIEVTHFLDGWQIPSRYPDLVCSMDVGLQCSIPGSESFSYTTWDFVSRDVPCLTTVDWIHNISGSLHVRHPYDVDNLADRIRVAADLFDPGQVRKYAEDFAKYRNNQVKSILKEELGLTL